MQNNTVAFKFLQAVINGSRTILQNIDILVVQKLLHFSQMLAGYLVLWTNICIPGVQNAIGGDGYCDGHIKCAHLTLAMLVMTVVNGV